jgi:DNA-binding MarR family transcriptional regulator
MGLTLSRRIGARAVLSLGDEVTIGLAVAAGDLGALIDQVLRREGVTSRQYHAMRMLRGAGTKGLTHGEIGSRLLAHRPDVTRLMTLLVRRRWVTRERAKGDSRFVRHTLTGPGAAKLQVLDTSLQRIQEDLLGAVGETASRQLVRHCERIIDFAAAAKDNPRFRQ